MSESPLGSNRGDSVDKWNKFIGVYLGGPWCASFAGYISEEGFATPRVHSGLAANYAVKNYSYALSDVIYGNYIPKPGDWRVKLRNGGGHVDIIVEWDTVGKCGYVIGGNVGDKVSLRKVTLQSMIADRTTHIVDVCGYYNYYFYQQPPPQAQTPLKRCFVSVYHPDLHGNRTASGAVYDKNALSLAHKTLPLGTLVQMTNPKSGVSITAKVTDRGPYSKKYEFDLSSAAFARLGRPSEVGYRIISR